MNIGDQVTDFSLEAYNYPKEWILSDFSDKKIILYFYPKDDTSGCTAEGIDFQENIQAIEANNAIVVAVSPDSVQSHEKFAKKFGFEFIMLADTEKKICNLFTVWVEKSMYGRKYMGVDRSTFIIQNQQITHLWRKVKVKGHVKEVMQSLQ